MKKLPLHTKIIVGLLLGIGWAFAGIELGIQQFTLNWVAPFGNMFISLLKLIALPLVLFSIIKGVSDLQDIKQLGSLGIKTVILYLSTTVTAIIIGLILVNVFKPGNAIDQSFQITNRISYELWVNETDNVEKKDKLNYLENPNYQDYVIAATAQNEQLAQNQDAQNRHTNANSRKSIGPLAMLEDIVPQNIFKTLGDNSLMLQVIFFALFFGITLLSIKKDDAKPIQKLVNGFNEVFLKMVDIVMKGAPFFVFALMAGKLTEMAGTGGENISNFLGALGYYSVVVLAGLAIMIFVIYPLIVILLAKEISYKSFFKGMQKAQTLAFTTSSSAATLPVTMDCVTNNLKVPKKVSSFVLPIGATVNMDGTSLYISVAVVFLAQFHMVDLSLTQQLTIVLTSTLASIGASAVPSAGLIMMIMVLQSVGLNPLWISLIFPVDRILDMCRTVVNVTGDAAVSTIVAKLSKESKD
ncbi:MAG: dicarboxylate/amino acid:cation symporter [Bacteroidetes bacterium]|nr:dicarboxylate/amino acid:cation symporter [Bacteroidota bacterium]